MFYMRGGNDYSQDLLLMTSDRFSQDVEATLSRAGWSPARRVDPERWLHALTVAGSFKVSPIAEAALREFGGLKIEQHGPGVECAREPFELDPLAADGYEPEFRRVEEVIAEKFLFPLGEFGGGQAFLAIAQSGSVYYIMERIGLLGRSIDEALTRLIEGRLPLRVWAVDVTVPPANQPHQP